MRTRLASVAVVIAGCSGGGGGGVKPVTPPARDVVSDAAMPVSIDAAPPPDAALPDAAPPVSTSTVDLSLCAAEPVDGVAKGMSYDCGGFSVRDVTSPERVPIADLVASLREKSEAAGAQVAETATTIAGADAASVLVHTDRDQVSLDVVAMHDLARHQTRIAVCTVPWIDPAERADRQAACAAAITARLAQPGFPARKLTRRCMQAAAHLHDILAASPAPGPESELLTVAADFLIDCTEPLAKCVIKAANPDAIIACWSKTVAKPSP